jgi:hypothetical protein
MRLSARGRAPITVLVLLLLTCALPARCFALVEIEDISKERAKQMGIDVRVKRSANNDAWVQVEFRAAGPLKEFRWADLEVTQGEKRLVTASLMPRRPAPDSVLLEFYGDPAALMNASVTIVAYNDPRTGIGYRLQMKDYLDRTAAR